ADLAGDRGGGGAVVAGHHDDLDAAGEKVGDRGDRAVFDGVGDTDNPRRLAVDCGEHGRLAVRSEPVDVGGEGLRRDASCGEQSAVAYEHDLPIDGGPYALASDGFERGGAGEGEAAVLGAGHDGGRQRVLRVGFGGGDQGEQLVRVEPGGG